MPDTREQIIERMARAEWGVIWPDSDPYLMGAGFLRATDASLPVAVKAVTERVREAAELDFSVWLREGTKVVRVTTRRDGYEVTESMIRVKDLEAVLDQIDAELGGER